MRRIVICDTGPLLHLSEANAIDLLELAGEVFIPEVAPMPYIPPRFMSPREQIAGSCPITTG